MRGGGAHGLPPTQGPAVGAAGRGAGPGRPPKASRRRRAPSRGGRGPEPFRGEREAPRGRPEDAGRTPGRGGGPGLRGAGPASGEARLSVERASFRRQRRPSARGVGRGPRKEEKEAERGGARRRQVLTGWPPPLRRAPLRGVGAARGRSTSGAGAEGAART